MAVPSQLASPPSRAVATIDSINPATQEINAQFAVTQPADLPAIFARARNAQKEWATRPLRERCAMLRGLRDAIFARRDEIAEVITREAGKPRVEAIFAEVLLALDTADFLSRQAPRWLRPEKVPHHNLAMKAKSGWLEFDPLGIVAVISPWNYPFSIPMAQVIPALATGNAVLLKPSELTPWCGQLVGELVEQAKFPAGLVQVLQGRGDLGAAIIEAAPDKVFFTGSVSTGQRIAEACAKKLIPSVLELGGKDAMIVLADANLEVAASAAVWGSYTNCGQVCLSVERLFVEQAVEEKFLALCVEKTKKLRLGPGCDPATDVGPLIRPQHVQRMSDLVEDAVARGARVLCGGKPRPDLGANFFAPTVIAGVNSSMKLFQEETFGPILAVQSVKDAEEAIAYANDSSFALAASVWTKDAARGQAIASRLRAGAVMVNDAISYFGIAEAPHGGCGASGWGRPHGKAGLLEMVQPKYIDVDRMPGTEKPWGDRYGADLERAADAFLCFEFGGGLAAKLRNARGALKTMFRDHGFR